VDRVLILSVAASGESFLKLDCLGAERGGFLCLKRISKSKPTARPDLFDTADLQLETSKQGTAQFVREYTLVERREAIGKSYQSLRHASEFASLLARNAPHMAEPTLLYQLTERTLDAFTENKAPEVIHLKALYLLLKDEGYPIRESWWQQLPKDLKEPTKAAINSPAPDRLEKAQSEEIETVLQNLYRWMEHETDLMKP
jgi:recombinational DNA repair protein (RecF pathway)